MVTARWLYYTQSQTTTAAIIFIHAKRVAVYELIMPLSENWMHVLGV